MEEDSPYFKQTTYKDDFIKTSNYDPNGESKGKISKLYILRSLNEFF